MHKPVLLNEVLEYLALKPNENFIDATFGEGGHSAAILEKNGPNGMVLGLEVDKELYEIGRAAKLKIKNEKLKNRLILVNDSFTNLKDIVKVYNFQPVHGILFDLGISSWHLEESGRGFSFKKDEVLDMRYDSVHNRLTAVEIVNKWSEGELVEIFRKYGEERFARRIAKNIIEERKKHSIKTTTNLVNIILKIKGGITRGPLSRGRPRTRDFVTVRGIHPATKIFQALRIAVNDELGNLEKALPQALEILDSGGRLVVISFHSLEDRIVKQFFKEARSQGVLEILTKKPIRPTSAEIKENPRSRSAKLRAILKI